MMGKVTTARGVKNAREGWQLFRNRKTLWSMLREVFRGNYRMSLLTNIITIAALIYVVVPFDLVTDLIPFVGWIDDGVVIFLLIKRLQKETQRYNRYKVMERKRS